MPGRFSEISSIWASAAWLNPRSLRSWRTREPT